MCADCLTAFLDRFNTLREEWDHIESGEQAVRQAIEVFTQEMKGEKPTPWGV